MKISCIDKEVKAILETGYYTIPRFQRPYLWDKEQVEDFWNDTVAGDEAEYFIGSTVVFQAKKDTYGLVDGQQRFTTITMVLCALRNALSKEGHKDLAKGVHRLIERHDINNKPQYILQTETSYPFFQEHIQKDGEPDEDVEPGDEELRLQTAFALIEGLINQTVQAIKNDPSLNVERRKAAAREKLVHIRDRILQLKLIFVELDNDDDAYIIFETLNTRGKDLSVSDLVKNHLTRLIKPTNVNVDLPKDKWNRIISTLESSQEDLRMNSFLHHFWLSRYEYTTEKKLFKAIRSTVKKDNAMKFLKTFADEAITYREIQETAFRNWAKNELAIKGSLDALNLFRVKQPLPMVMAIMREYKGGGLKTKQAESILGAIENFHFMFTAVTSQRSSGGISLMYAAHARALLAAATVGDKLASIDELKGKLRARKPSFQEFEANLADIAYTNKFTKQKKLVQYILAKVDAHHSHGLPVDYNRMTIEHIGPQNPPAKRAISDDFIGKLGNLILVDAELNNKLANKDFPAKVRLLNSSRVWVDEQLKKATSWNDAAIASRLASLAKMAHDKVWRF